MPGHRRDPRPGAGHPLGTRGQPPSQGLRRACFIRCRGKIRNVLKSEFSYRRCGGCCLDSLPVRPASYHRQHAEWRWLVRAGCNTAVPACPVHVSPTAQADRVGSTAWGTHGPGPRIPSNISSPQPPDTRPSPVAQGKVWARARLGACAPSSQAPPRARNRFTSASNCARRSLISPCWALNSERWASRNTRLLSTPMR